MAASGPALSGKTTNLMQLHELLQPQRKGELMVLETRDDRTLFFDVLPIGLRGTAGLDLRLIEQGDISFKDDSAEALLLQQQGDEHTAQVPAKVVAAGFAKQHLKLNARSMTAISRAVSSSLRTLTSLQR